MSNPDTLEMAKAAYETFGSRHFPKFGVPFDDRQSWESLDKEYREDWQAAIEAALAAGGYPS